MGNSRKLLIIGWDAADWKVINPLMDQGLMPTLNKLVNNGVMGSIATLDPPLSPTLWTSIATGKRPFKHGIIGFTEPTPDGKSIQPVHITSRKVKAFWNILNQENYNCNVVGWWPSHPAEPINGCIVSNFFQRASVKYGENWPIAKGTIHPPELEEVLAKCRVHPQELTAAHLLPFVPNAKEVNQSLDKRLYSVSKILADCSSLHSATTYLMENTEWDVTAVYLDAIDHFCHGFMKMHPPQMPGVPDDLFYLYKNVVSAGYRYHDMMLERLLELANEDTTVILVSDHGFHPSNLRPLALPKEPAAPALEHSPYGIVVMKGPGIKKDEIIYGSSILDITPTILHMLDLPVGEDMDGKILINAFEEPKEIRSIASWEQIEGETGEHPKDMAQDPYSNKEALDQLIALGYIEKPDENSEVAVRKNINENKFYEARAYKDAQLFSKAIEILKPIFEETKEERFGIHLAQSYMSLNQLDACKEVLNEIREKVGEEKKLYKVEVMLANIFMREGNYIKALNKFKEIEKDVPDNPRVNLLIAQGYISLNKFEEAEKAVERELVIDKESERAYHTLGFIQLRTERFEEAVENILTAVGYNYNMPIAHYHLGFALYQLGEKDHALNAFNVCLKMAPNVNRARDWVAKILEEKGMKKESEEVKDSIVENISGELIIVTGLPRSGTSMIMQMLEAGGIEIFTDGKREGDESNPLGYYEHEAVKSLDKNKAWIAEANGKAVKVISHLIPHLPKRCKYKVIHIIRDIDEVISSQHKMLASLGKAKSDTIPLGIKQNFQDNLSKVSAFMAKEENFEVLEVKHHETIENPHSTAQKISEFLGIEKEVEMAGVVDSTLYRNVIDN